MVTEPAEPSELDHLNGSAPSTRSQHDQPTDSTPSAQATSAPSETASATRAPATRDSFSWSRHSKAGREHLLFERHAEAEEAFTAALEASEGMRPSDARRAASIRNLARVAEIYWESSSNEDYARTAGLLIASLERDLGTSHPDVEPYLLRLGMVHANREPGGDAEDLLTRALAIRIQQRGADHLSVATALSPLGTLYLEQNRLPEAEQHLEQSRAIVEENLGPGDPAVAAQLASLAPLRDAQGRPDEAEQLLRRALEIELAAESWAIAIGRRENDLAYLLIERGQYEEATELGRSALAHFEKARVAGVALAAVLDTLALSLKERGEFAEAAENYERAIAELEGLDFAIRSSVWRLEFVESYAEVLRALGRDADAQALEGRFATESGATDRRSQTMAETEHDEDPAASALPQSSAND
jgi:tetratricopeptide (TPR) repeat protein